MDGLLLARIAGLPAAVLAPLQGKGCGPLLDALAGARTRLAAAREELGAEIHRAVAAAAPEERRLLLRLKREVHNGRGLQPFRARVLWPAVQARLGEDLDRVLVLEQRLDSLYRELETVHDREMETESAHLIALAARVDLRRGLALSSPVLLERLPHRGEGVERKDRRLRLSLLRYVSRAALKLSPFSTLTRFALARPGSCPSPVELLGSPDEGREVSLLRWRRYLIEQVAAVLEHCPELRDALPVAFNRSLREVAPGRYRLLTPVGWRLEETSESVRYAGGLPREVSLEPAVAGWLEKRLAALPSWEELRSDLAGVLGEPGRADSLLRRLRTLGVLLPVLPWFPQDAWLEERLSAWLAGPDRSPGIAAVARPLNELLGLEAELARSREPAACIRALERRLEEVWTAARQAAGLSRPVPLARRKENELYEDVVLLGTPGPESLAVDREALREVVRDAEPWFRIVDLFAPRHELLHTFTALAKRRWPERREVPALELFAEVLPHWAEIRRRVAGSSQPGADSAVAFDPLGLPEIAELGRLRHSVWSRLRDRLQAREGGSLLEVADLQALAAELPAACSPRLGPCLFLQPADAEGRSWMLNRIFEGTGRYASRITPLLPSAVRETFLAPLLARSTAAGGEAVELLDLVSSRGDSLNVHAIQTHRVLTLPGEPAPLPLERQVDPGELRIRWREELTPELVDGKGHRLLPVHLGATALAYMPPWIVFLAQFGPGEVKPLIPPRPGRRQGDIEVLDRVTLGRLILVRRRYRVPAAVLREVLKPPSSRAFAALDAWRRGQELPASLFLLERVQFGDRTEVRKPQFLDFRSPSFCRLLAAALPSGDEELVFEEVLPSPEAFPRDPGGEAWAVEIQLDTLAV